MLSAIARNLPRLDAVPISDTASLTLAAYGPSLKDTYQDMRHPILGMSGASKWLYEHGIKVDFHLDMDPRPHKVAMITPPIPGVIYLIASVSNPNYFELLKDEQVLLWHAVSSNEAADLEWLGQHDPGTLLVTTGSNVGLAAFQIGGILGYRHFEVHGMDGSFEDRQGPLHAGEHTGKKQKASQKWMVGGKPYYTPKVLANGAAEVVNNVKMYPIFAVFHGEGLVQALVEEANVPNACRASNIAKAERVRRMVAEFVAVPSIHRKRCIQWSAWEPLCLADMDPLWIEELQEKFAEADKLRPLAKYNTGSISLETGMLLRAACAWKDPKVVVEIGTFIGKSTAALQAQERIYTCDKSNDCVASTDKIITHPYQSSTQMLLKLVESGVQVDFFYFDGRLADADIPLVLELSAPGAVYAFDDWHDGVHGKGKSNMTKLLPWLSHYGLIQPHAPFARRSTLALLVPTHLSGELPQ